MKKSLLLSAVATSLLFVTACSEKSPFGLSEELVLNGSLDEQGSIQDQFGNTYPGGSFNPDGTINPGSGGVTDPFGNHFPNGVVKPDGTIDPNGGGVKDPFGNFFPTGVVKPDGTIDPNGGGVTDPFGNHFPEGTVNPDGTIDANGGGVTDKFGNHFPEGIVRPDGTIDPNGGGIKDKFDNFFPTGTVNPDGTIDPGDGGVITPEGEFFPDGIVNPDGTIPDTSFTQDNAVMSLDNLLDFGIVDKAHFSQDIPNHQHYKLIRIFNLAEKTDSHIHPDEVVDNNKTRNFVFTLPSDNKYFSFEFNNPSDPDIREDKKSILIEPRKYKVIKVHYHPHTASPQKYGIIDYNLDLGKHLAPKPKRVFDMDKNKTNGIVNMKGQYEKDGVIYNAELTAEDGDDFGEIGKTPVRKSFILKNVGQGNIEIDYIRTTNPDVFKVIGDPNRPKGLKKGESLKIEVEAQVGNFLGSFAELLQINYVGATKPLSIIMRAKYATTDEHNGVTFPNVPLDYKVVDLKTEDGLTKSFIIRNSGNKKIKFNYSGKDGQVTSVELKGNTDVYSLVKEGTDCSSIQELAVGSTCEQKVKFKPKEINDYISSVVVKGQYEGSKDTFTGNVALSGAGGAPELEVQNILVSESGHGLDFGAAIVGETATSNLELRNVGNMDLTISSVELSNDGEGQLSMDENKDIVIKPKETKSIPVKFTPKDYGTTVDGRIKIKSNAHTNNDLEIKVIGVGGGENITIKTKNNSTVNKEGGATALGNFGAYTESGDAGRILTVTYQNDGYDDIQINSIATDKPDSFAIQSEGNTCTDKTLNTSDKKSCEFKIKYIQSKDYDTDNLVLTYNDSKTLKTKLSISKMLPIINIKQDDNIINSYEDSKDLVNFGNITVGNNVSKTFTIENVGYLPLNISSKELVSSDGTKNRFEIKDDKCGATLAPDAKCTFVVEAKSPENKMGIDTGTLTIKSNSSKSSTFNVKFESFVYKTSTAIAAGANMVALSDNRFAFKDGSLEGVEHGVRSGTAIMGTLTMTNNSSLAMKIKSFSSNDPNITINISGETILKPGETKDITLLGTAQKKIDAITTTVSVLHTYMKEDGTEIGGGNLTESPKVLLQGYYSDFKITPVTTDFHHYRIENTGNLKTTISDIESDDYEVYDNSCKDFELTDKNSCEVKLEGFTNSTYRINHSNGDVYEKSIFKKGDFGIKNKGEKVGKYFSYGTQINFDSIKSLLQDPTQLQASDIAGQYSNVTGNYGSVTETTLPLDGSKIGNYDLAKIEQCNKENFTRGLRSDPLEFLTAHHTYKNALESNNTHNKDCFKPNTDWKDNKFNLRERKCVHNSLINYYQKNSKNIVNYIPKPRDFKDVLFGAKENEFTTNNFIISAYNIERDQKLEFISGETTYMPCTVNFDSNNNLKYYCKTREPGYLISYDTAKLIPSYNDIFIITFINTLPENAINKIDGSYNYDLSFIALLSWDKSVAETLGIGKMKMNNKGFIVPYYFINDLKPGIYQQNQFIYGNRDTYFKYVYTMHNNQLKPTIFHNQVGGKATVYFKDFTFYRNFNAVLYQYNMDYDLKTGMPEYLNHTRVPDFTYDFKTQCIDPNSSSTPLKSFTIS